LNNFLENIFSLTVYMNTFFFNWIPNAITFFNLQCGFLGLLYCSQGLFPKVYLCSVLSCFFDFMDGKVARYLQVESPIGAQLDSLADIVSFVVVPSMVGFVKYQYIVPTSIYLACGAYRLARFNVSHSATSFEGVSTPLSNIVILVSTYVEFPYMYGLYLLMAGLMVSKIKIIKI